MRRCICLFIAFGFSLFAWAFQPMLIMPGTVKIEPGHFQYVEAYCYQPELPIPRGPWNPITFLKQEYDNFEQVIGEAYVYFPRLNQEVPLQLAIDRRIVRILGANSYHKVIFFNSTDQLIEISFREQIAIGPKEMNIPRRELGNWGVQLLTEANCDREFIQKTLWAITSLRQIPEGLIRKVLPIMAEIHPKSPDLVLWAIKECTLGREVNLSRLEQYAGIWLEETELKDIEKTLNALGYKLERTRKPKLYQRIFRRRTRGFKQVFTAIRLKVEDETVVPYLLTVYRKGEQVGCVMTPLKEGELEPSRNLYLIGRIVEESGEGLTIQREDLETGEEIGQTEILFKTEKQLELHVESKGASFFVEDSMAWVDCKGKPENLLRPKVFKEFLLKVSPNLIDTMYTISILQGLEGSQWLYITTVGDVVVFQLNNKVYLDTLATFSEKISEGKVPKEFREIPQGTSLVIVNQWDPRLTPKLVERLRATGKWKKIYADESPRLARYNLLKLSELTVGKNVGVIMDTESLLHTGVKEREIKELKEFLLQEHVPVKDALEDLGTLREIHVLLIAAHNDEQLQTLLAEIGKSGALTNKFILAFFCNQDGTRYWIGELVRKYGAISVIAYPGLIHFSTVKSLVEEFVKVIKANPDITADEALYGALQKALNKPNISEWQKEELKWMLEWHWQQISLEQVGPNLG